MTERQTLSLALVGVAVLILAASCAPPTDRPSISAIESDPLVAQKGGTVLHTVRYTNASEEQSFSNTVLVVRYSEYLEFDQNASPFPDDISERDRELSWKLGTLPPKEGGSIRVQFRIASKIPIAVYELKITAEISSPNAKGPYTRSGRTLIEGHPTPTPKPTRTPEPTPASQ